VEPRLPRLPRIRSFAVRRQQRIKERLGGRRRRRKPHRFYGGYLTEAMAEQRLRDMSERLVTQTPEDAADAELIDDNPTAPNRKAFLLPAWPIIAKLGLALSVSFIFLRIGAVTFGGGYVMIPEIENEVVK